MNFGNLRKTFTAEIAEIKLKSQDIVNRRNDLVVVEGAQANKDANLVMISKNNFLPKLLNDF